MKKFLVIFLVLSIVYSQKPNTFQTLMLNNLLSNSEKNVCISPLSIYQIVSLLSNGATGKTKNEILNKDGIFFIPDILRKETDKSKKNKLYITFIKEV